VHITRPHRALLIREDTDDRVKHPAVPAVPGADCHTGLRRSASIWPIFGIGRLDAIIHAPFQQGFQGLRRVGMVSG